MTRAENPRPPAETPWEFYPDDDLREEPAPAAEDDAMHVEFVDGTPFTPASPDAVVHYLDDEEPEIPDRSIPRVVDDETPQVDALLVQQHYMTDD
ncbi:MAG: hypothetical protein HKN24_09070 [Acidimicrobiales bacterium]|nr:hypothetical protein [Acidimicrobiales bacterium]